MNHLITSPDVAATSQRQQTGEIRLKGGMLLIARATCSIAGILALLAFISSIPATYNYTLELLCEAPSCLHPAPGVSQYVQQLHALGFSVSAYALYNIALNILFVCCYFAVAAILFWRKSNDWMALLATFFLVTFAISFAGNSLVAPPQPWQFLYQFVLFLGYGSVIAFFYSFPNGRFLPRWTAWLTIGAFLYWGFKVLFPTITINQVLSLFAFLGFVGTMIPVQVYRYLRLSNRVQRQQTKWVVFGMAIAVGGYIVLRMFQLYFFASSSPSALATILLDATTHLLLLIIPVSIAFAILRSRLWDIDLIINRTLVYGLLTAIVIGLYVLVVGGLSALLQARGNLVISLLATGLIAVLFQPLRYRLQRAINRLTYGERDDPYRIISRLGTQLEATLTPDAILPAVAETVAKTLKLLYVAIELKEEGELRLVAAYGTPVEPSLRLPLRYQQEMIGQLLLAARSPGESFSSTDRRLLDDLAHQAGIAANAVLLSQDVQRSRERLLLAREEERRRLARELHDSVSQALYGISLGAHAARTALDRDPEHVAEPLDYILTLAEAALAEMRALIFELRPESLETEGLVAALAKQAAALQARYAISVATELCDEPELPLPLPVKEDLYRIAQEAMHNTVKHARASRVDLRLAKTPDEVVLEIRDDGVGFDTSGSFPGHLGLHSMSERVTNLGGMYEIESWPGAGTRIVVRVPASV